MVINTGDPPVAHLSGPRSPFTSPPLLSATLGSMNSGDTGLPWNVSSLNDE